MESKRIIKTPAPKRTPKKVATKLPVPITSAKLAARRKMITESFNKTSMTAVKQFVNKTEMVTIKTKSTATKATSVPKTKKKTTPISFVPTNEVVVILPGVVSVRLQEKKALYEKWFALHANETFDKVARIFGYMFVITGLLSSAYILNPDLAVKFELTAALPCSFNNCQSEVVSVVPVKSHVVFKALPSFVSGENILLVVEATGVSKQVLIVSGASLMEPLRLYAKADRGCSFTYDLPTSTLVPDRYTVRLEGYTAENVRTSFAGPAFTLNVGGATETALTVPEEATEASSSTEATTSNDLIIETVRTPVNDIRLLIEESTDDTKFKITVVPTYEYEAVELFMRPNHSTIEFLIGRAELVGDNWHYNFNGADVPKGEYTILAKGIDQHEVKAMTEITLSNKMSQPEPEIIENSATKKTMTEEVSATAVGPENHAGTTSEISTTDKILEESVVVLSVPLDSVVAEALASLAQPLATYAYAVQTNNALLLSLGQAGIADSQSKLLRVKEDIGYSPAELASFEIALSSAVAIEQKTIHMLNKNNEAYHPEDTDRDGLADFEETHRFLTSSTSPDTDDDGIMDGVEVIMGFEALDSTPETTARFTDTAATFETLLGIEVVVPVAWHTNLRTETEAIALLAEVSGFAIPGSYVVLNVPEAGLKTLFKVNSSGKFSVLLNTELPNGTYSIVAAYLDNYGRVVGKSRAFSFTKTDDNINALLATKSLPGSPLPVLEIRPEKDNLVGAIGLVAFGFILLFLSRTLRAKRFITRHELLGV